MSNFKYTSATTFIGGYYHGLEDVQCEEMQKTVDLMAKMGGSFVKSLATAWMHADPVNKRKLVEAFQDYFADYYQKTDKSVEGR